MKKRFTTIVSISGLALVFAGCAGPVADRTLPESSPASPQAAESPQPPATPLLMVGAQGLAPPPPSTNQMKMQHEHNQPASANKAAPQPSEKHEHEQPKKEEEKK
jgi:PBP1b-binding outer membrane lipoprotein LpoB